MFTKSKKLFFIKTLHHNLFLFVDKFCASLFYKQIDTVLFLINQLCFGS